MGKRKWLIVIIIAAAVVLVMALWRPWEHHHEDLSQYRQTETEPETVQDSESETVSETEAYVSPIDFDKGLQGQSCCCRLFVYRAFLQQYDDGRSHDGDLRT